MVIAGVPYNGNYTRVPVPPREIRWGCAANLPNPIEAFEATHTYIAKGEPQSPSTGDPQSCELGSRDDPVCVGSIMVYSDHVIALSKKMRKYN